jgi:hypothetical protein
VKTVQKPAPVETPKQPEIPVDKKKSEEIPALKKPTVGLKESPQLEAVKTTESIEVATPDSPTTLAEHDYLRPNLTLRLKPTTAINDGEKLKLEVRFIAQPEPTVKKIFSYYDSLKEYSIFCSGNLVF